MKLQIMYQIKYKITFDDLAVQFSLNCSINSIKKYT